MEDSSGSSGIGTLAGLIGGGGNQQPNSGSFGILSGLFGGNTAHFAVEQPLHHLAIL